MKENIYRVVFHGGEEEFVRAYDKQEAYIKARALPTGCPLIRSIRKLTRRNINWEVV